MPIGRNTILTTRIVALRLPAGLVLSQACIVVYSVRARCGGSGDALQASSGYTATVHVPS